MLFAMVLSAPRGFAQDGTSETPQNPNIVRMHMGPMDVVGPTGKLESFEAEIVVGEATNSQEIESAKSFLVREVSAQPPEVQRQGQVVLLRTDGPTDPQVQAIVDALPYGQKFSMPEPPWYANARLRKLMFASIRIMANGGATAAIYLSEKAYPLEMSIAGAGLAAVMSGLLQYYSVPLVKHYLDYPFLNRALRLPSRQFPNPDASPLRQTLGKSFQSAEYWLKWYGLEVGFIGLTAATLVGMASWIGFDMGPDFDSWKTVLSTSLMTAVYSMAGQGSWDRFIINRLNHWTERAKTTQATHPYALHKVTAMAEGSFALNSMASVVLALTSMTGAEFAVTGLYAYAGSGIIALSYDWIKTPISRFVSSVKRFFGISKKPSACETLLDSKKNDVSWLQPIFFLSAPTRVC